MSGRSYPIWNRINSCIYSGRGAGKGDKYGNKSYGVKHHNEVTVYVGTSSKNSHKFVEHSVTHRIIANGDKEFRFHLDGEVLKTAILRKGESELEFIDFETREIV